MSTRELLNCLALLGALLELPLALLGLNPKYLYEEIQWGILLKYQSKLQVVSVKIFKAASRLCFLFFVITAVLHAVLHLLLFVV